jgi:hypothetical protein
VRDPAASMVWLMLIYIHLGIGFLVGVLIIVRRRARLRWVGALLAWVCIMTACLLPATGHGETTKTMRVVGP